MSRSKGVYQGLPEYEALLCYSPNTGDVAFIRNHPTISVTFQGPVVRGDRAGITGGTGTNYGLTCLTALAHIWTEEA